MAKVLCAEKGCDKWAQVEGKCKAHAHGTKPRPARSIKAVSAPAPIEVKTDVKMVIEHVEKAAAVQVKEVIDICEECSQWPCVCVFQPSADFIALVEPKPESIVLQALRDAYAAKEAEWLADLDGLKPGQTLCRAVRMVSAIESLGY
jgi:hypothetical protein